MTEPENIKGQPDLLPAALFGLCPDCGQKTLFAGLTRFADKCRACGLDYSSYNVGDGPAAFLTLIVGGLMLALALIVELNFHPPIWVHFILWFPLTIAAVIGSLRISKAALLISEHRNQAHEGRIDGNER
ncbi:Uncharacterized protein DUF983 associated with cytochrome c oxidase? [hydrothermal vent metagenome]|uniref:Uncharacterized protein DUF983 associated with cytochrome c oxidase n=1 Tax=hydrothermal vent metagenome TaxID=652676 RepID=A0A3B0S3Z1_9ZZZZ